MTDRSKENYSGITLNEQAYYKIRYIDYLAMLDWATFVTDHIVPKKRIIVNGGPGYGTYFYARYIAETTGQHYTLVSHKASEEYLSRHPRKKEEMTEFYGTKATLVTPATINQSKSSAIVIYDPWLYFDIKTSYQQITDFLRDHSHMALFPDNTGEGLALRAMGKPIPPPAFDQEPRYAPLKLDILITLDKKAHYMYVYHAPVICVTDYISGQTKTIDMAIYEPKNLRTPPDDR